MHTMWTKISDACFSRFGPLASRKVTARGCVSWCRGKEIDNSSSQHHL